MLIGKNNCSDSTDPNCVRLLLGAKAQSIARLNIDPGVASSNPSLITLLLSETVFIGDSLREMSNPVLGKNKKKYFSMSSTERLKWMTKCRVDISMKQCHKSPKKRDFLWSMRVQKKPRSVCTSLQSDLESFTVHSYIFEYWRIQRWQWCMHYQLLLLFIYVQNVQ